MVQKELNEIARNYGKRQMMGQGMPPQQYPGYQGGQGGQFRM
ncbi:MAG: hypothetical protein RXQ77_03030 [Candidatus Nanopusillus sp.]